MESSMWQPIETAPKDGTLVDLWMSGPHNPGERQPDCWYENGKWLQEFGREGPLQAGNWVDDTPTHWMPKPLPPEQ